MLQYLFLLRVVSVVIIKLFFVFKIYTDMFMFPCQGEHHVQADCCQQSMRIVP